MSLFFNFDQLFYMSLLNECMQARQYGTFQRHLSLIRVNNRWFILLLKQLQMLIKVNVIYDDLDLKLSGIP
jgi:hypothetical protein